MKEPRPRPVHPGEILREDFLPEFSLTAVPSPRRFMPRDRVEKLIREKRAVSSADTAMRLARYFNITSQFWLNLQANFDLASVADDEIKSIEPRAA